MEKSIRKKTKKIPVIEDNLKFKLTELLKQTRQNVEKTVRIKEEVENVKVESILHPRKVKINEVLEIRDTRYHEGDPRSFYLRRMSKRERVRISEKIKVIYYDKIEDDIAEEPPFDFQKPRRKKEVRISDKVDIKYFTEDSPEIFENPREYGYNKLVTGDEFYEMYKNRLRKIRQRVSLNERIGIKYFEEEDMPRVKYGSFSKPLNEILKNKRRSSFRTAFHTFINRCKFKRMNRSKRSKVTIPTFKDSITYCDVILEENEKLFDLSDKIKNFSLDTTLIKKLTFMESLTIYEVDRDGNEKLAGGCSFNMFNNFCSNPAKPINFSRYMRKIKEELRNAKERFKKRRHLKVDKTECKDYEDFLDECIYSEQKRLHVNIFSKFLLNLKEAGSIITSCLNENLHTIEEKRTEYVYTKKNRKGFRQKELRIHMRNNFYEIRINTGKGEYKTSYYRYEKKKYIIGEAANYILSRYFAIKKFVGKIKLSAIHISGALCENLYEGEILTQKVNKTDIKIYRLYRTITDPYGIRDRSCTMMTLKGRIIKHVWENCNFCLQINPLLTFTDKKILINWHKLEDYDINNLTPAQKKNLIKKRRRQRKYYFRARKFIEKFEREICLLEPANILPFVKYQIERFGNE